MIICPLPPNFWIQAAEIHQQCFQPGWSLQSIEESLSNKTVCIWGAFNDCKSELMGFCIFQQLYEIIEILTLCTRIRWQRNNVAMQILDNIFAFYAQESIDKVILEVHESNYKAIALYNKLGFEKLKLRLNYYGIDQNAIVMQKMFENKKNKIC